MQARTREAWRTVFWLTLYVGVAPFVSIAGVMFLSRELGATDDSWGWIFALGYMGAVWLGAQLYARHFER